jgi:ketosteroid isomerase-like protein
VVFCEGAVTELATYYMTMNSNLLLIQQLYTSFQQLDAGGMKACYHPDAVFSDPVFPNLNGEEVGSMWTMLIEALKKNKDQWKLEFTDVKADDKEGSCHWEAHYTFSLTGRRVHNSIDARFEFRDGKIFRHTDSFDFYRWARMAFGPAGALIGWTGIFKQKLRQKTNQRLQQFIHRTGT